jgi:tape measure domain-containing protein
MAIKEIAVRYRADIRDAERNVKQLQKITDDLTDPIHDIRIEIKDLERAKQVVQEIDRFLDVLQKRKVDLAPDITKLENLRNKLKEIDREIENLRSQKIGLDSKGIKEINNEINKLQRQKKKIQFEIEGLEKAEKEVKDIEKTIGELGKTRGKIYVDDSQIDETKEKLVDMILKQREADGKLIEEKMRLDGSKQVLADLERTKALIDQINSTAVTIKTIGAGLENVGNTMLSMVGISSPNPISMVSNTAKFLTKGFGFSALYRLTSKMMNSVESFVSDAMHRFDTLRNARSVFEQLGYSTEEYDGIIATLQDRLAGLPTTTDEAIMGIQKMVAQLGADKATKTFLALNDGILGFGGSTEQVNRAVTQLSQSLGSGYIDGQTYRALMDGGLSPVMTKLAEKFGYATEEVGEFKNAIGGQGDSKGRRITPDEFLDALIGLDATDVEDSMYSLAQKATKGFTSGLRNMRTAIIRGFTSVLTSAVEVMETEDVPNFFSDAIAKFGKFFETSMNNVAKWIKENGDTVRDFFQKVAEYVEKFVDAISSFDLGSFFEGLKESTGWIKTGIDLFKGLFDVFTGFLSFLGGGDVSKGAGRFLGNWIRIGTTLSVLGRMLQTFAKPLAILSTLSGGKLSLPNLFGKLFGKGKEMSDAVGGVSSFTTAFDKGGALNKLTNLAFITGLIGDLYLLAVAIGKFNEAVPSDMGETAKKIGSMVEIVGAMGAMVAIAGSLTKNFAVETLFGELGLLGLAVDLGAFALAIKEFDENVPADWGNTFNKILSMSEIVGAMATLAGALGGITWGTGGAFAAIELVGMGLILGLAGDLAALGKAVGEFDKNMPSDVSGIQQKIKAVNQVISAIGGANLEQMFKSGFKAGTVDNVKNAMQSMVEIAKSISKMMKLELPKVADVTQRIKLLDEVVGKLSHGTLMEQWGASINKDTVNQVKIAMGSYIEIAKALNELQTLIPKGTDTTAMTEAINAINSVISNLKSGHGNAGWLQEKGTSMKWGEIKNQVESAKGIVDYYKEIANTLVGFKDVTIDTESLGTLFTNIGEAIGTLSNVIGTDGGTRQKIVDSVSYVSAMNDILKQLKDGIKKLVAVQSSEFDVTAFGEKIDQIKQAMDRLIDLDPNTNTVNAVEKMAQIVQSVSDAILDLQTMTTNFTAVGESYATSLYNGFADQNVGHLMEAEVSSAIETLNRLAPRFKEVGKSYQNALIDGFGGGFSVGMAAKMAMFASTLTSYTGAFRSAGVTLGQAFADGVNSATANISVRITGSGASSGGSSFGGRIGSAVGRQYGGVIYRSNGGETVRFIPRGTDTVPAMLTPGEYVVRREAVQKIGLPLLEKLNSMDIQGMFHMFMNNFAMGTGISRHTVINNVTNNDNRRIDISGDRVSRRGQLTRANRFMKAMAV